ncbi:MAG: hypothetical protein QI199_04575, partial [Candidatus Korarchaeota archaeon]|nr:hypothetical protein [Candidatus Korarchaeota archaeon]
PRRPRGVGRPPGGGVQACLPGQPIGQVHAQRPGEGPVEELPRIPHGCPPSPELLAAHHLYFAGTGG